MGRKKKPKCEHGDCFTCPYDDCIAAANDAGTVMVGNLTEKRGPGRPKLPPGVVHQHQLEYAKQYYQRTKEKRAEYYKEYYQTNMKRIKAQQKEYRERRKVNGKVKSREYADQ